MDDACKIDPEQIGDLLMWQGSRISSLHNDMLIISLSLITVCCVLCYVVIRLLHQNVQLRRSRINVSVSSIPYSRVDRFTGVHNLRD